LSKRSVAASIVFRKTRPIPRHEIDDIACDLDLVDRGEGRVKSIPYFLAQSVAGNQSSWVLRSATLPTNGRGFGPGEEAREQT